MKRTLSLVILAMAAAVAGCGNEGGTSPGAAPGSSAAAAVQDSDLKVAADYADEAEKDISTANYKSELDSLEKDIDAQK